MRKIITIVTVSLLLAAMLVSSCTSSKYGCPGSRGEGRYHQPKFNK